MEILFFIGQYQLHLIKYRIHIRYPSYIPYAWQPYTKCMVCSLLPTLLDTLEEYKFDAAIGGARRDEEKARAKERFFRNMLERGIYVSPSQFEGNFISLCHTDEILDYVLKAIAESIE